MYKFYRLNLITIKWKATFNGLFHFKLFTIFVAHIFVVEEYKCNGGWDGWIGRIGGFKIPWWFSDGNNHAHFNWYFQVGKLKIYIISAKSDLGKISARYFATLSNFLIFFSAEKANNLLETSPRWRNGLGSISNNDLLFVISSKWAIDIALGVIGDAITLFSRFSVTSSKPIASVNCNILQISNVTMRPII